MPPHLNLAREIAIAGDFAEAGRLVDGYTWLLEGLHEGTIETVAIDTPEPSPISGKLWMRALAPVPSTRLTL